MMGHMITTTSSPDGRAEQLSLLPNDSTPARFRLSRETRERGLRHVAEIRRLLAERADATAPTPLRSSQPRRDRAA